MGEVIIHGYSVTRADYLLGVKFWAQFYGSRVPHYEVYEYVGHCQELNMHFFVQRTKTSAVLMRRFDELNIHGFRPFLLDLDRLERVYQEIA